MTYAIRLLCDLNQIIHGKLLAPCKHLVLEDTTIFSTPL